MDDPGTTSTAKSRPEQASSIPLDDCVTSESAQGTSGAVRNMARKRPRPPDEAPKPQASSPAVKPFKTDKPPTGSKTMKRLRGPEKNGSAPGSEQAAVPLCQPQMEFPSGRPTVKKSKNEKTKPPPKPVDPLSCALQNWVTTQMPKAANTAATQTVQSPEHPTAELQRPGEDDTKPEPATLSKANSMEAKSEVVSCPVKFEPDPVREKFDAVSLGRLQAALVSSVMPAPTQRELSHSLGNLHDLLACSLLDVADGLSSSVSSAHGRQDGVLERSDYVPSSNSRWGHGQAVG
jgi:hypothetical protein